MKLVITIDVSDTVDPTRTDPHEVAEAVLAEYETAERAGNFTDIGPVEFLGAEWAS